MERTFDRWLLGAGGLVVLLVVAWVLAFQNTRRLKDDASWVAHTHNVIDTLAEIKGHMWHAEAAQRTYLITGGDGPPPDFAASIDAAKQKVETVKRLTVDNEQQQAGSAGIAKQVAELAGFWSNTNNVRMEQGFGAAKQILEGGQAHRMMTELTAQLRQMDDTERALLQERSEKRDHTYLVAIVTGLLTGAASLAGVVAFMVLLRRHLAARTVAARLVAEQGERLRTTLASIGDAVIVTDTEGRITIMNAVAESLTGWTKEDATGQPLDVMFRIINQETRQPVENPATRALREGVIAQLANHTVLIARDGTERPIDDGAAPIRCKDGEVVGCVLIFRDITERRKAERLIEDARAYAENIVNTVREPLLVLDAHLRVVTASRSFCQMFQVTPEETQGQFIYDLGNRQWDIPALRKLLEEVVPQDKTLNDFEVEHNVPNIGHRVMLLNARRVYRQGNHTELVLLAMEDITDRKHGQAVERRLAAVVESSEDAIISKSLDGIIQSWNAAAERLFGFTEAEAVGRHISIIIPADRSSEEDHIIARIRAGERIEHFDTVRQRSNGQCIPVSLTISPVRNDAGQVIGASKIARNISDRKQAEEKLRESERQLTVEVEAMNRLYELVSRLLVCRDLITAMNEVLDATITLVGSDMGNVQLVNAENGMLEIVAHRGFTQEFLDHFRYVGVDEETACGRAMKSGKRVIIEDVQTDAEHAPHLHIAISEGWHGVQSTPLMSRKGEVLGMISTHYRKPHRPAERDLRILDLYARQAADFIERIRAEQALRDAGRHKDEFLAMLAHELRNPLAPIRNAVQIMRLTGGNTEASHATFEMMDRQVSQIVRLVDDLLDMSRISRGKIELRRGRVELASVVNHAVEAARPYSESMGQELTATLPPTPIYLNADPTRLAQVVGNLLNNACKFTQRGGHIRLSVEREGEQAVLRVCDDGIGIAADQLRRIFGMFVQVDTSLERSASGLGLGLTLVKNLVEMHDGTVEVHSAGTGQGSEFVVRLPIMLEAAKVPPTVVDRMPKTAYRILVVDDNRDSANSLAMLLKLAGNETTTAYDGLDAVETAATFRPDVILLDIGLPKLDGYRACRRIREQFCGSSPIIVALTGWGQAEDKRRSQEAGFNAHMVKPVSLKALTQMLAEQTGGEDVMA